MSGGRQKQHEARDELRYLQALLTIEQTISAANSVQELLRNVLDAMLDIFECDRAWLLYPCDPNADSFTIPMERTRPEWPGAAAIDKPLPMDPWSAANCRKALASNTPCRWDPEQNPISPLEEPYSMFHIQSMMLTCVRPHVGKPWALGIHNCAAPHVYSGDEDIFESIAGRMADGLSSLLAREQAERSRYQLEEAQRLANMGSFEWSERTKVLECSRGLLELLGVNEPITDPRDLAAWLEPSELSELQSALHQAQQQRTEVTLRTRITRRDGELRHLRLQGRVDSSSAEGPTITGVVQDITEAHERAERERQLEAQLFQAHKMEAIGKLTGGVAHDFNNLLTVMLGSFDVITNASNQDLVREMATQGRDSAQRAAQLTHRLLAFSRKQTLKPEVVDVGHLLADLEVLLRRTLGEAIEIEIVRAAGLWHCEVDPAQLENVIVNLAINARDAMPHGGRLTIETGNARVDQDYAELHDGVKPGQYVLLAITDAGQGMSQEVIERAFEPFFTTKEVGRGSGLGLSMAYGFVKQSGGHIKIYSELAQGTTVKVYLPRHYGSIKPRKATVDVTDTQGQGELVLVVEDDPRVRATTVLLLERLGYSTLACASADEAAKYLESDQPIDLLFTDVVLPGSMNGVQLAEQAHQQRPKLPVLFTSGYTENAVIHHGRLDPEVTLVEKPFTVQSLARSVRRALTG